MITLHNGQMVPDNTPVYQRGDEIHAYTPEQLAAKAADKVALDLRDTMEFIDSYRSKVGDGEIEFNDGNQIIRFMGDAQTRAAMAETVLVYQAMPENMRPASFTWQGLRGNNGQYSYYTITLQTLLGMGFSAAAKRQKSFTVKESVTAALASEEISTQNEAKEMFDELMES